LQILYYRRPARERYSGCGLTLTKERFAELFSSDKHKARIDDSDILAIKEMALSYRNADIGLLRHFGITK